MSRDPAAIAPALIEARRADPIEAFSPEDWNMIGDACILDAIREDASAERRAEQLRRAGACYRRSAS